MSMLMTAMNHEAEESLERAVEEARRVTELGRKIPAAWASVGVLVAAAFDPADAPDIDSPNGDGAIRRRGVMLDIVPREVWFQKTADANEMDLFHAVCEAARARPDRQVIVALGLRRRYKVFSAGEGVELTALSPGGSA